MDPDRKTTASLFSPREDRILRKRSFRLGAALALALLAGATVYRQACLEVIGATLQREASSHGFFVPLLAVFFIRRNRDRLAEAPVRCDWSGLPLVLLALSAAIFDGGLFQIRFLSFLLLAAGLLIVFMGRQYFKGIRFALFFLTTMVPLTGAAYERFSDLTRHVTFSGALWVLSVLGIPHYREGWFLQLPNAVLEVAVSCSGIRYLISYFVFGLAYAYLTKAGNRSRTVAVLLTIPISLAASILRLTAIFVLTVRFGPQMAAYWPHVFISWAVFFGVLILSIGLDRYMQNRARTTAGNVPVQMPATAAAKPERPAPEVLRTPR